MATQTASGFSTVKWLGTTREDERQSNSGESNWSRSATLLANLLFHRFHWVVK